MTARTKLVALAGTAALMVPLVLAPQAPASELVEFQREPTLAANGPIPPVPANPREEVKEACGSETATFGSELFTTTPSQIKVKNEWGDVIPGKEMMVSGTVTNVEYSHGDLPIDHPFSFDFTFNVLLDEPYWPLARDLGLPGGESGAHELHMELEVGALPHSLPQREGPAEGEPWELLASEQTEPLTPTLNLEAHEHLVGTFIPHEGERIAIKGRWIVDCAHPDFHTELHPITFMAFGHRVSSSRTIVHVLSNPYRVTQLYGAGTGEVNSASPKGAPFPQALEADVTSVTEASVVGRSATLALPVGIERTNPSTTPWLACAPEGAHGLLQVRSRFVTREGVRVRVNRQPSDGCASVSALVGEPAGASSPPAGGSGRQEEGGGEYTALQPRSRSCEVPWPYISQEVAEGLGVAGLRRDEVEQIKVAAAGGTFTISHGEYATTPIPYDAGAAQVQSALEALPTIGEGNVHVTGGPGGGGGAGTYTIAFIGTLAARAIEPLTTDRSGLTATGEGVKLATVIVIVPGGSLDLRRFILSLIEQREKATLERYEEAGLFVGAISRIEANVAHAPQVACLDPLSAPPVNPFLPFAVDQRQPFPYYGEVEVERAPPGTWRHHGGRP
jgi:hypothetical protein